jgi:cell division protein FtsI (penicillin-binding protein 3)
MSLKKQQLPVMKKILILIVLIFLAFLILILSVSNTIQDNRNLPSLMTSKKDLAVRGNIYSSDGFKIATSRKIFSASIDTRSLNKEKRELFITLFSIYSGIDKKIIRAKIKSKRGYVILSRTIDQKTAKELQSLAFKLRRLDIFKALELNGNRYLHGLSIYETGEERVYTYEDAMTPVLGFIRELNSKAGKQRVNGINGIEREFNDELNNFQDGVLKGERDVLSYIIFNKDSQIIKRRDGDDIHISIPLKLQKNIELMLDRYKKKLQAQEVYVSVMESDTGKILALASSNRYNPSAIKKNEIRNLSISAIEYNFEPGSVIKPIAISLALDKNLVKKNEIFSAYNKGKKNSKGEYPRGRYKIGRYTIKDDHRFEKNWITLEDIIIHSSNIGTLTIANRLSGEDFFNGYKNFGFSFKTGIDLPYEKVGVIHKLYQYKAGETEGKDNIYKATDSYGQGITTTFMQVLKAYSVFNNQGTIVTPYIVNKNTNYEEKRVISEKTANYMHNMLVKTVEKGTGQNAQIEGLEIGGKTGTAQVVEEGRYQRKYISSFFGFANDKDHKYTIGVTVNDPVNRGKHWYYYYASHSAVPVFKEVIKILVKLDYLKPTPKED